MATTEEILTQKILDLLLKQSEGLEVDEIIQHLQTQDSDISPRGVRNLLNRLLKEEKLIKRKRQGKGRGKPPYAYFNLTTLPQYVNPFQDIAGVDSTKSCFVSKTEIEKEEIEPQELERQKRGLTVLERIAANNLLADTYAKVIIDNASELAAQNPIDLVVNLANWVVKDLNQLGEEIQVKWNQDETVEAKNLARRLDERLTWARSYLQRFWRLDRSLDEIPGILDLPTQAKNFFRDGRRAQFNEENARKRLKGRIIGNRLIEEKTPPVNQHKAAVGTDASIAKIFLNHTPGSFIPPDPVIVTTSAAAMVVEDNNPIQKEYLDFDISPDGLEDYEDYSAAAKGLVLSPNLMRTLGADSFKRAQTAALELRQYHQDFCVATRTTKWRPMGAAPELDINPKPTLIFRDGRVFPVVHRINFYEADGLYGDIVRNQIEEFAQVIHNTLLSPMGEIIYGSAVKNPELSWLAPLVFWYLHNKEVKTQDNIVVQADDVYKVPFADTAVAHILFLGLAKHLNDFSQQKHFVTCQVIRRFSDIAFIDNTLPIVISEDETIRSLDENEIDDWQKFITQRIARKEANYEENILDEDDYKSFIYICHKVGVLMCYAAPTSAYEIIVNGNSTHFLIPRLEVAINLEKQNLKAYQKTLDKMLSWLAAGHWKLDLGHTQSGFDEANREDSFPVLVPDVTLYADEAARFARDKLSDEVEEKVRNLITDLKKHLAGGR
jgi:predicted transcriptional regulator